MACANFVDVLNLYAGNDLPADDARKVEEHLTACSACREELESIRKTLGVLGRTACTEEMLPADDPSYWREVESKLRERALGVEKLSLSGSWWIRVPSLLAQAALVLIVAGAVVWYAGHQTRPAATTSAVATIPTPKTSGPLIVVVRAPGQSNQAEVSAVPVGADVSYSDFGHVVYPSETRRLRNQVITVPVEETGDTTGGF